MFKTVSDRRAMFYILLIFAYAGVTLKRKLYSLFGVNLPDKSNKNLFCEHFLKILL